MAKTLLVKNAELLVTMDGELRKDSQRLIEDFHDGATMIGEVRQALLLQRVGFGPDAMTAREALEIATLGGARGLNRDDIGALAPGMAGN